MDKARIRRALVEFLEGLGHPEDRNAVERIASRVADAWAEDLLKGYTLSPGEVLSNAWSQNGSEIIVVKDIEFTSICKDHLLPFYGKASVAYVPDGRIVGFSKIADLVDCLSRRLQIQETLTEEIADSLMTHLRPKGAACQVTAEHACVAARGPRRKDVKITTLSLKGVFSADPAYKNKFLQLVR